MKIITKRVELETQTQFEIIDITAEVRSAVKSSGIKEGQVLVYCPHTTTSIRINHNEPLLHQDIFKMVYRLAPVDISYAHDVFEIRENVAVGERTNGHAHVKAFLFGSSETIPILKGEMVLNQTQSIFFVEFDGGRKRDYVIQVLGE